ncbi:MAG: hypothetical protein JSW50_02620 [Candidatus Latescibacterota bacterium]|nr:MAG: hypothetical protein JSW50_02620 [Candidatus Latescibacterota bacterium]
MRLTPLVIGMMIFTLMSSAVLAVDFGSHWHDGRAEIDGYRLTVDRYGEERTGTCVMIYVTEPFSESKRVKADDPNAKPDDTFEVLKLNLIRDFQTGIYDYNTMLSVYARTADFSPVKISFTSSEWCGNVYEDMLFYPDKITGHHYSYFEGESGPIELKNVSGGVAEDNLFILLRGLKGEFLEPGAKREMRVLPSVYACRLAHTPPDWVDAVIGRVAAPQTIEVPAGEFTVTVYTVEIAGGRVGAFYIEEAYPHRVIRWEMPPDIKGELTGSERLVYWKLNRNGDEKYLRSLGLEQP